jgi:very-short-patch-repair endonuclease
MAAVLACGPGAVLSHRAAIALWELRPVPSGPIDVTVAARSRRPRQGIRLHNVRSLHDDDRDTVEGIPVTSLHRTLLDYAQTAWEQHLRHAVDAAERRERLDARKLEALYERSRGHHGIGALKAAVARLRGSPPWTRSELERRFLALIRDAGLPEPQTNVLIEGELVDCFWPEAALIVEVDSYEFHKSRAQFDADRRRDAKLMVAGYRVLRVTQPRVEFGARALVSDLRALLALPAGR